MRSGVEVRAGEQAWQCRGAASIATTMSAGIVIENATGSISARDDMERASDATTSRCPGQAWAGDTRTTWPDDTDAAAS